MSRRPDGSRFPRPRMSDEAVAALIKENRRLRRENKALLWQRDVWEKRTEGFNSDRGYLSKEYTAVMQNDPGPNPYSEEYTIILRRVQEVKEMVQKLDEEVASCGRELSSMNIRLDILENKSKKGITKITRGG